MSARLAPVRLLAVLALLLSPGQLHAQSTRDLQGSVHNVTVGITGSVTMQITRNADGTYALVGAFDNVTLAGDVTAVGRTPLYDDRQSACAPGQECVLFDGQVAFDQRTGFATGTVTSFTPSLVFDTASKDATGVYHIGPLAGFGLEQSGIINFSRLAS